MSSRFRSTKKSNGKTSKLGKNNDSADRHDEAEAEEEGQLITHIRRCHVCGEINEAKGEKVTHCHSCGKYLSPFYFFDENLLLYAKNELESLHAAHDKDPLKTPLPGGRLDFKPLYGFVAFWVD